MKDFFAQQVSKLNDNHIKNLIAMAKIDGHLHGDEVKLLYKMVKKYNYDAGKVKELLENDGKITPEVPTLYSQKLGQLYDLVLMMMADNVIDDNELEYCEHMASLYGFRSSLITSMIEYYQQSNQDIVSWNDFTNEAKKHQKSPVDDERNGES